MTATYPGSVFPFTTKIDDVETIYAADVNNLQNEIMAIESVIGLTPGTSTTTYVAPTGGQPVYNPNSYAYSSVVSRLNNIEQGIVQDVHVQYVHKNGGDVVIPSSTTTVGLTIKASAGQTADLQEWQDATGTTLVKVTSSGNLTATSVSSPEINNAIVMGIFA
jgi:hypothetical protein